MNIKNYKIVSVSILLFLVVFLMQACGGSSSNNKGVFIEGILTEGGGTDHQARLNSGIKHGAGEFIEEVMICGLGKCSRTDGRGQWGFFVEEENFEHNVMFTVDGHGINTSTIVTFPNETKDAFVHFEHNNGKVIVHHMDINGERVHSHGDMHSHDGHSH